MAIFEFFQKTDEVGKQRFGLSREYEIQKGGKRLGVQEKRNSTSRHKRMGGGPVRGPGGDCGKPEHFDRVWIIVFIGNGEGHQVKIGKRSLRFDREQASPGLLDQGEIFGFGVKYA